MHFYLGANLPRLEMRIVVGTLLKRFPDMKLVQPPTFTPHPGLRKLDTLEVQLLARS